MKSNCASTLDRFGLCDSVDCDLTKEYVAINGDYRS